MEAVIIVGAVVIIALIAWGVVAWTEKANKKYQELWSAVAGTVNGTVKGNSLTGTYNGVPVQARINAVSDDNSSTYYCEITLSPGAQGKDWSLSYSGEKLLGTGAKSWQIKTKDNALKQRLAEAGALAAMQNWPVYPEVIYKSGRGSLKYEEVVGGMYAVPDAPEFQARLELLARLAEINKQVNTA